jgi:antitoxin component of MazEF toxin-antitoxin module
MSYPTKVQRIKRKTNEQFYVPFPAQVARMIELQAGEDVEWGLEDRQTLVLRRPFAPEGPLKKKSMIR